jgi:hypothetical protein
LAVVASVLAIIAPIFAAILAVIAPVFSAFHPRSLRRAP